MLNKLTHSVIVDVRTPDEYRQGHYPDAVNIPLNQVVARVGEIKSWNKPVVLYCRSGNRSAMALSLLVQQGLAAVSNGGGLDDMRRATR
ncbi:MAG: rhodanese-like domain-containing protein [Chitinophagaceae bacterium]|nr:MAG: rhodanese-like domain-containing protein [Chitinophagaceae bacterium]